MKQLLEALDLALEALESYKSFIEDAHIIEGQWHWIDGAYQAITAIKQARSAPEEPVYHLRQFGDVTKEQLDRYMATGDINPQPAPVQEPAWYHAECDDPDYSRFTQEKDEAFAIVSDKGGYVTPLYTVPFAAPVQEFLITDEKGRPMTFWGGKSTPPAAQPAPVQDLPFGVGGGLVAIKTLLSRDPCVHANTAIEMIDAILKEHPAAQRQWVGLTDEEIEPYYAANKPLIKWVEAKLKEKNT
jgi:hypothetical protein